MCDPAAVWFAGDRDTGVRVVLRARPLNSLEKSRAADSVCISIDGDSVECKVAKAEHAGTQRYSFDKVFGPDSEQRGVYEFIGPQAINGEPARVTEATLPPPRPCAPASPVPPAPPQQMS